MYAQPETPRAPSDIVLKSLPPWHWGTCLAGYRGLLVFTNAESVRLYRAAMTSWPNLPRTGAAGLVALPHPPIEINDFVGSLLEKRMKWMDHVLCRR